MSSAAWSGSSNVLVSRSIWWRTSDLGARTRRWNISVTPSWRQAGQAQARTRSGGRTSPSGSSRSHTSRVLRLDTLPAALGPTGQGCLAASCATATAALLLAVLTSVTIALFPHRVPLQGTPAAGGGPGAGYIAGGGRETCDPVNTVIPPGLRHEYWVEISVGQAGETPLAALLIAPFLGAWLGVLGGGLARRSPGTSRCGGGGPHALSPPQPPGWSRWPTS